MLSLCMLEPIGRSMKVAPVIQPSSWWCLDLGDAVLASSACEQIKDQFRTAHAAAAQPQQMAIFTRQHSGDLHCQVFAYFTPSCAELAAQWDAQPCAPPARAGLELLAGAAACWEVLFASSTHSSDESRAALPVARRNQ